MKAKARENLEAALRLLDRGLVNAAASRLYCAVFRAAVHAFERAARTPLDLRRGARGWSHWMVQDQIARIRGRKEDHDLFRELKALREIADYDPKPVPRREIAYLRPDAERFILETTS